MENNLIETTHPTNKPILTTQRLIGLNQQLPFCCIVSESTVAYIAGCSFVIENIRTLQQEILWVGQNYHEILKVEKKIGSYGPMKIVMLLKNQYEMMMEIVMFVIDWNNYFYRKRNQKCVRIPEMVMQVKNVILKFDSFGESVCLFSEEYNNNYLTIFPTNNQSIYSSKTRLENKPTFIESFKIRNQSYYCLVYESELQILNKRGEFRGKDCGIYRSQENGLLGGERIVQIQLMESCVGQILGFVLGDRGSMVIFRLIDDKFEGFFRIDVRVIKQLLKVMSHEHEGIDYQLKSNYSPQQLLLPTCFNITNNRILLCYPNIRKLVYITFSLLNHTNYSIHYTENLIYLPSQKIQDEYNSMVNKLETEIKISSISLSYDLCTAGLMIESEGYRYIHVLDMLNLLVPNDKFGENGGMRLFGNFGCKGVCKSVAYLERESELLILFENNKGQSYLSYYIFPYCPELSHIPPYHLLKWSFLLKNKAHSISAHPLNKTILILYYQLVRIHYYTHEKLSQNYININIPNCQCGSFSPYGDKIVLCNSMGIYVIDTYTMQIRNFVTGWAGIVGKLPTGLTFINNFDLIVEYGFGVNTYLLQLCDYKKIKTIGQLNTSVTKQSDLSDKNIIYNKTYNTNPSPPEPCQQTLIIDAKRQLVIHIIPGHQLKFYNINLEILNVLSIQPTCIMLDQEIEALFVGNLKGELYIFRWPDIVDKVSNIREFDPEIINVVRVHKDRIVSISVSLNLRYVIVVSASGEISFLQFLQENSPNITRQGALSMLKKSTLKPLLQTCLTSASHQNRRTETIIKAVGKQVEVNKNNEKVCTQLKQHLQQKLKELNLKTLLMIKDEIDCSAEETKIRALLRQIQKMKLQIIELKQRRQHDLKFEKQNSIKILTKKYAQGAELEKFLKNKHLEYKTQKIKLKTILQKQYNQQLAVQAIQYDIIIKDTNSHKKMENKMQSYNERQLLKVEEEKLEEMNMIGYQFQEELDELCQRRNQLQNSIRKYTVYIKQYNHKNMFTGLQIMQLKNDIEVIAETRPERKTNKQEVALKLNQIKTKNEDLIVQHRELQQIKQKSSKKAEFVQNLHKQLLKDIKKLQCKYEEIKHKKLQLDDSFYCENKMKIELNKNIGEMQAKVLELRYRRDKIKQELVINTNKISRSMHTEGYQPTQNASHVYPSANKGYKNKTVANSLHKTAMNWKKSQMTQLNSAQTTQQNIQNRDGINQKLEKLNNVKNQRIKRFNLISKKLIMDHKRLTSQYNELKRYNDLLVKKQQKLILQIKYGALEIPTKQNKIKQLVKDIENKQNKNMTNSRISSSNSIRKNGIFCKGNTVSRLKKSGFVSLYQNADLDFGGEEFQRKDSIVQ